MNPMMKNPECLQDENVQGICFFTCSDDEKFRIILIVVQESQVMYSQIDILHSVLHFIRFSASTQICRLLYIFISSRCPPYWVLSLYLIYNLSSSSNTKKTPKMILWLSKAYLYQFLRLVPVFLLGKANCVLTSLCI